jgi:hypothetical protein
MMKYQEEMLQSLNMLHRQVNKDFGSKQATSARQVATSRSHGRRDDHRDDKEFKECEKTSSFTREID